MNKGRLGAHLEEVILDLGFNPDDVVPWRTGEEWFTLFGHRNLVGYNFVHTSFLEGETDYEDRRITQVVWPAEVIGWAEEAIKKDRKAFWDGVHERLREYDETHPMPNEGTDDNPHWLDDV